LTISPSKHRRKHAGIWQERYYEHTIRDEKDWHNIMSYIKYNPMKHAYVDSYEEWKYS
ncbi:MAG: transposase, partial [Sulfurovum sp.]|nr:transposase [Sulfurovum sp.]